MPTESEIQKQREREEIMRQMREEFATRVWPKVAREIGQASAALPPVHQAAWLAFCAAKEAKP